MQRLDPVGISCREPASEDITEELVEAIGPRVGADADQEEVGCLERLEPVRGVVPSGEGPAPVGVELVERGEREEAVEALRIEPGENLAGEVVGDVVIGSGESPHERGRVGVVAQRQRRQVHPGGPTFRPRRQRVGVVGAELDAARGDHPRGVPAREPQLVGSQLAEEPVDPPPGQGQRRVGSAAQHERHGRGEPLDQEAERCDRVGRDHVQIVDHQGGAPLDRGQVVHQRRHHVVERQRVLGEQRLGVVPDAVAQVRAGGDDRGPEPGAVGVGDVAGQPGPRPAGRWWTHSVNSTVLPAPAGAATNVTGWPSTSRSSAATGWARGTTVRGGTGGPNLVTASCALRHRLAACPLGVVDAGNRVTRNHPGQDDDLSPAE